MKESEQDGLLAAYLLGQLPEAEELRLEAEYLADRAAQERLAVLEDELVDGYVRNQLIGAQRQQLEARFLASPRGREKLALAQSLLALTVAAPTLPELRARRARRRWIVWSAAAAAVVLLAVLALKRGGSGPAPPRGPSPALTFAMLEPGLTRGQGALARVELPAGASALVLELRLDADRHAAYRVELLGAGEAVRWRAVGLSSRDGRAGARAVVVQLPATALDDGEHTLVLSGDEPGGAAVAEYGFFLHRP